MISVQSFQLTKEYEKSKVNNIDSKFEICYDRKLGEGMHTMVYECRAKGKFDIDDKSSSDYSDPDQRRVASQL